MFRGTYSGSLIGAVTPCRSTLKLAKYNSSSSFSRLSRSASNSSCLFFLHSSKPWRCTSDRSLRVGLMMLSVVMPDRSVALEPAIAVRFRFRDVPSGVAKKCVAIETRHTNTSSCTRGAGGDTPQLAPRETDSRRDTQYNEPVLFEPDAPAPREGPRQRWPATIG